MQFGYAAGNLFFWIGIKSHASGQNMKANYYYASREKFQCFT